MSELNETSQNETPSLLDPIVDAADGDTEEMDAVSELAQLKLQAQRMGIPFSPNIGLDTLRERVRAALTAPTEAPVRESKVVMTATQIRQQHLAEATKLVRVRITCHNPMKKEWRGEVFTFANSIVGSIKKFVPYNTEGDETGYHIPHCIYQLMKEKKYQSFVTKKLANGDAVRAPKLAQEFTLEVLPQLTQEELNKLAADQRARNALAD